MILEPFWTSKRAQNAQKTLRKHTEKHTQKKRVSGSPKVKKNNGSKMGLGWDRRSTRRGRWSPDAAGEGKEGASPSGTGQETAAIQKHAKYPEGYGEFKPLRGDRRPLKEGQGGHGQRQSERRRQDMILYNAVDPMTSQNRPAKKLPQKNTPIRALTVPEEPEITQKWSPKAPPRPQGRVGTDTTSDCRKSSKNRAKLRPFLEFLRFALLCLVIVQNQGRD